MGPVRGFTIANPMSPLPQLALFQFGASRRFHGLLFGASYLQIGANFILCGSR